MFDRVLNMPLQNKNGLVKVRVNVATKRKTVSSFFDDGRRIQIAIAMLFSCCQAYLRQSIQERTK